MSYERLQILAKPNWQKIDGHPVIDTLTLDVLRALDGFFDHIGQFKLTLPTPEDFLAWATLAGGADDLRFLSNGLSAFDAEDPTLAVIEAALSIIEAKETFCGTDSKGRPSYERSVSVPFVELPEDWQVFLQHLRVRRIGGDPSAPAPDIQDRMIQKLSQYVFVIRRDGLGEDLHQEGLTAFYGDISTRISARSGTLLRPATLRATWEELERFARLRGSYSEELGAALKMTLAMLREEELAVTQLKYEKMHGLGGPPDIIREAFALLGKTANSSSPGKRHILRNRAAALGLPAILPLRRDWDRIVFGKTLFWDRGRYRFRNFKPGKTALLDGRRTFPASIPPRMSCFIDALLLHDNDPKYLEALRQKAEQEQRPLFVHPNGMPAAKSYVSRVWAEIAGTGATISRTMMHDHFGAKGEEGLTKAMILCDQYSPNTPDHYKGVSVHQRVFNATQDDLLQEFEDLMSENLE
ncbi:hypothetical protein KL867_22060 [Ruegeria litorea]|uniref:Tyr recombinase domain-containing protein n=1 Tax=Falsiruegeria litorea TaxID=1280831 RepID=A0ABS5WXH5_9RHOB|nr:hypothetical protein [Falsiruegeria litorea]MBT3143745.1 hypothetical protein [Falsiruegeria litorea]